MKINLLNGKTVVKTFILAGVLSIGAGVQVSEAAGKGGKQMNHAKVEQNVPAEKIAEGKQNPSAEKKAKSRASEKASDQAKANASANAAVHFSNNEDTAKEEKTEEEAAREETTEEEAADEEVKEVIEDAVVLNGETKNGPEEEGNEDAATGVEETEENTDEMVNPSAENKLLAMASEKASEQAVIHAAFHSTVLARLEEDETEESEEDVDADEKETDEAANQ
ncbi:hypothetical protein [Alteribacillus bidgolensis]|uniref:Uncharacterized protein n=1 Tax=Alteribacillus bidgolensis TaxID=930129 RepID=A0A1G8FS37_9BACI|nr:hypothetical protein [Alteribacillus bidgolensis]SDH84944.1 hypothetical protein SAMN05216352_10361 [Alteribacillus bidgolensis]